MMLSKTCLDSILVYLLSFIKLSKWAIRPLNTHMANYMWNDFENSHKYHLANFELVLMCKVMGV